MKAKNGGKGMTDEAVKKYAIPIAFQELQNLVRVFSYHHHHPPHYRRSPALLKRFIFLVLFSSFQL